MQCSRPVSVVKTSLSTMDNTHFYGYDQSHVSPSSTWDQRLQADQAADVTARSPASLIRVKKEEKEIWRGARKKFEKSQRALLRGFHLRAHRQGRGDGGARAREAEARRGGGYFGFSNFCSGMLNNAVNDNLDDDGDKRRRGRPRRPRALPLLIGLALICAAACVLRMWLFASSLKTADGFDCVIVPGGGLDGADPAAWVTARLDAALAHDANTLYYLVLSRGTTHKPPPLSVDGFPIDEAAASARYLVARGVAPSRVLLESWSLDTIGNAAFARLMHADLRAWRRMLIVTSAFHRPRTEAIFNWVFGMPDANGHPRQPAAELSYEEVPERGLGAEQAAARRYKETQALEVLQTRTMAAVIDLKALHTFIFVEHGAYKAKGTADDAAGQRDNRQPTLATSTY